MVASLSQVGGIASSSRSTTWRAKSRRYARPEFTSETRSSPVWAASRSWSTTRPAIPSNSLNPLAGELMSVELDHAIVPSRDRRAAAELLAMLLGVPWAESGVGPFCPVYVNGGLTLDFDQLDGSFPVQHYCFRVSEADFDAIVKRIEDRGIAYRSMAQAQMDLTSSA